MKPINVSYTEVTPHRVVLRERLVERFGSRMIGGAEIGVWWGHTAAYLLATMQNLTLYLVDPWDKHPDLEKYKESGSDCADVINLKGGREFCFKHFEKYGERHIIFDCTSEEAARQCPNGLAFVFVDGDHSYEAVKTDIEYWKDKLLPDGYFYFHDYGGEFAGVKQAVDEYINDSMRVSYIDCGILEVGPYVKEAGAD